MKLLFKKLMLSMIEAKKEVESVFMSDIVERQGKLLKADSKKAKISC